MSETQAFLLELLTVGMCGHERILFFFIFISVDVNGKLAEDDQLYISSIAHVYDNILFAYF